MMNTYPHTPGYKRDGTSRDAAVSMLAKAPKLCDAIMACLKSNDRMIGHTADEVAYVLNETPFSCRPRFTELARRGLIADTGIRRPNASGRMAKSWRAL